MDKINEAVIGVGLITFLVVFIWGISGNGDQIIQ